SAGITIVHTTSGSLIVANKASTQLGKKDNPSRRIAATSVPRINGSTTFLVMIAVITTTAIGSNDKIPYVSSIKLFPHYNTIIVSRKLVFRIGTSLSTRDFLCFTTKTQNQ